MDKIFNLIINGVGGQGLITLLSLVDEAALIEKYDVKSSELHGLSQRGGSVETHLRFGKKVNSPLISPGQADLIISLEAMEALREISKAGKNTKFLINKYLLPFNGSLKMDEVLEKLNILPKENVYLVEASKICNEKLANEVVATLYLLGFAQNKNLIPFKKESILQAINNIIPEKYKELNINAFNLAYDK